MRSRQHLGRPGTAVIPPRWEQSHGKVFEKTMPARVALRHSGVEKTFNDTDRKTDYTNLAPYVICEQARVQAQTSRATDQASVSAEETLVVTGYLVTISLDRAPDEEPIVGDLVDVLGSNDSRLTGQTLVVTDVVLGSLRFERDLMCSLVRPATTGPPAP